jgi:hypothetical protein
MAAIALRSSFTLFLIPFIGATPKAHESPHLRPSKCTGSPKENRPKAESTARIPAENGAAFPKRERKAKNGGQKRKEERRKAQEKTKEERAGQLPVQVGSGLRHPSRCLQ